MIIHFLCLSYSYLLIHCQRRMEGTYTTNSMIHDHPKYFSTRSQSQRSRIFNYTFYTHCLAWLWSVIYKTPNFFVNMVSWVNLSAWIMMSFFSIKMHAFKGHTRPLSSSNSRNPYAVRSMCSRLIHRRWPICVRSELNETHHSHWIAFTVFHLNGFQA